MGSVVSEIQALGVEVIHIPGGCTGLCQPLDVGVNKPFKARVRRQWEEWMMDMIDATNEVRDATRAEVIEWATATYWDMALRGKRILRNAWRKTDYDWFPGAPDLGGDDDGNDHDDDNNDDDDGDDMDADDDDFGDDDDNYIFDEDMLMDDDDDDGDGEGDEEEGGM